MAGIDGDVDLVTLCKVSTEIIWGASSISMNDPASGTMESESQANPSLYTHHP